MEKVTSPLAGITVSIYILLFCTYARQGVRSQSFANISLLNSTQALNFPLPQLFHLYSGYAMPRFGKHNRKHS